jgi:hypothetical protein
MCQYNGTIIKTRRGRQGLPVVRIVISYGWAPSLEPSSRMGNGFFVSADAGMEAEHFETRHIAGRGR